MAIRDMRRCERRATVPGKIKFTSPERKRMDQEIHGPAKAIAAKASNAAQGEGEATANLALRLLLAKSECLLAAMSVR